MTRDTPAAYGLADSVTAAEALLGSHLVRILHGQVRRARIVETEAYWQEDPASHSFAGETPRTRVMFGPAGRAYIYRIHRVVCLNVVAGPVGRGEAVLIRAVEPLLGIRDMERSRASRTVGARTPQGVDLTNGPGKLCQALDVSMAWYGADLLDGGRPEAGIDVDDSVLSSREGSLFLEARQKGESLVIARSPRIGISKAVDEPMRFFIVGNQWVSRRP